jgi:hypothetical protein
MTQPGTDPLHEPAAQTRRSDPPFARGPETRTPASATLIPATAWPSAARMPAGQGEPLNDQEPRLSYQFCPALRAGSLVEKAPVRRAV